jgi:Tfp pilus assembly protein PilF/peroxiredoxin
MSEPNPLAKTFSRRALLKSLQYAPIALLPAPWKSLSAVGSRISWEGLPFRDLRITPHYPSRSPIDDMMGLVAPGSDQFLTEKYAVQITERLKRWASELKQSNPGLDLLGNFADGSLRGSGFLPTAERELRRRYGIHVAQRKIGGQPTLARVQVLTELHNYIASLGRLRTTEFQIVSIRLLEASPLRVEAEIRYTFVGDKDLEASEQRIGTWQTEWLERAAGDWRMTKWITSEETVSSRNAPLFVDATEQAFPGVGSYREQLLRGADDWRTVLDGASGIDVYGNQGIAVGDFDGDGFDDFYVCQPAGLPNRLYRNRGDGTFEDVTASAGLDVLDATSCALFADFENRGHQDLLVVTSGGPLLFVNSGQGRFSLKRDAIRFARSPQGTFTHAALADYDHDGRLDVYFCLYNYYAGLDQYRYPAPYFDARNGPANFLLHNDGDWTFSDRTERTGLDVDNDRYSFACAWGDLNGNGWPDLYVANDFGRSNLYRNNGDGTFSSIAAEAHVEDVGAGMSACWLDSNPDGQQDIYVANMWSAAGLRVSNQSNFHGGDSEEVRDMYRRHARGNSFYRNLADKKFRNVARDNGTEYGGWAWSSDHWDFDHDGHSDIYIANGYVSGMDDSDLASFFWRQVVGNSPAKLSPSAKYEAGWNAINELIRSDRSWSGYERNVFYCNHGDRTFSDISGIAGLDFLDDSRAFALVDLDHDGRLEVLLKNRNAPQLRLLQNVMPEIGGSLSFRLRGTRSNRDAIGAAITIDAAGSKQTKHVQAGSGFLSQHTKEVFFGVGDFSGTLKAMIRWPSGAEQGLEGLSANHRIEVTEGSNDFRSTPFPARRDRSSSTTLPQPRAFRENAETWLLQPLRAPGFSLPDTAGRMWDLHAVAGNRLLIFWANASPKSQSELRSLSLDNPRGLEVLALNVDDPPSESAVRSFAEKQALRFPILLASSEVIGTYNIVFRYLFDRHRDLGAPTSWLIDRNGMIVKVYQGEVGAERIGRDLEGLPRTPEERKDRALPFPGTLHLGAFERNDFTYGVAFFQRGYLDAAPDSFKQVIASKPDNAEAQYNLGTLYLRRNEPDSARLYLEKAIELKPTHAEAWNNLGMIAGQQGHVDEAIRDFRECLRQRPDFVVALLNLGNLYRHQEQFADAEQLLNHAMQVEPDSPDIHYGLAMLYTRQNLIAKAEQSFENALRLRPEYAEALNNYGVLLVREQRYSDAEERFRSCIRSNPNFDQAYLNLARLYVLENNKGQAREILEQLLRQQPQHAMAQQALKMLQ